MSQEEQLALPKPVEAPAPDAELRGGAPASKNRSPSSEGGTHLPAERARDSGFVPPSLVDTRALRTWVIRSESEFAAQAPAWSALLADCGDATVFMSHDWLHSWWTAYRPDAQLAIVLAEDGRGLRGIAPMMIQTARRAGVSCRVLRFIGDGTGETDHIGFLVSRDERALVIGKLLRAIEELEWDVAEFNHVPEKAENTADLLRLLADRRLRPVSWQVECPVRRLPPTRDGVLAGLPSRLRTSIRSSRKKLQQRHRVEFGLHTDPRALDNALDQFFANHESRWRGKGQHGAFADRRRQAFYQRLTPRLLDRGWLRFFFLKLDDRVVAQQYCFALDDTVMLLQEGFDFARASDNVGNVLRATVFEHLVGDGARCYDFLAGSSRHKAAWSDGVVNDLRIRCARPSWRGRLFHDVPLGWERAKDVLRPWRERLRRRPPSDTTSGRRDGN